MGDKRGPSRGDQRTAPGASELGAKEVARKRRKSARPSPLPLRTALAPNDIWCTDFKGPFHTGDGVRCDPFTLTDAYSRYLLSVKAVDRAGYADCRSELERVFREYGLPRAIRSENGPPFASVGVTGLSRLAVWWLKLGIMPERIEPGGPEQNGRHERMHKTLLAPGHCSRILRNRTLRIPMPPSRVGR